jgi:RNA polymerase sigma factor (sigma-70 family)
MTNPKERVMKVEYTYHFNNGEKITIRIEESDHKTLKELDRAEYNNAYAARRRRTSIETLDKHAANSSAAEVFERTERLTELAEAMKGLSSKQQELVHSIYFEGTRAVQIAKDEGVSRAAISQRVSRALKKLKKLLS